MNKITNIIILSIFGVLSGCDIQKQDSQVFSGKNIEDSDIVNGTLLNYNTNVATKIVMISYPDMNTGFNLICTGTFISNKFILTAEHCLTDLKGTSVLYRPKKYSFRNNSIVNINIVRFHKITNPNYTVTREKIGLIEFEGGLPKGATVAALPDQAFEEKISTGNHSNQPFYAVGYGRTTGIRSDDLMKADGGLGSLRFKNMTSSEINSNDEVFLIDQKKNKGGVCGGDSGGPALAKNPITNRLNIIGIASAIIYKTENEINNKEICKEKSVYLNIFFYNELLREIIQSGIVK